MTFLLAAVLATAPVDVPSEVEPPAPQWPGAVAMWAGGTVLTVSTVYGGITANCVRCPTGVSTPYLKTTTVLVGTGIVSLLSGLMWLAWSQPEGAPKPKGPGVSALVAGALEIAGGSLRTLYLDAEPFSHNGQLRFCAAIIGTGIVALAAGVAWLVWANR